MRWILFLLLLANPAQAAEHFVFGMTDGNKAVLVDADTTGSVLIANGAGTFESDLLGRFEIVPVVQIPPVDCPDLVLVNVTADAQCCGSTVPWKCLIEGVRNDGRKPAGAFRVRVTLTQPGGIPSIKCNFDIASLAVGATAGPFSCVLSSTTPTAPVGDWVVLVEADQGAAVCEANEANNKVVL